jgi:hypothetical protein
MIKKIVLFIVLMQQLVAVDGYEVYTKNCQSCHLQEPKKDWVLKNLDKMKAPPMIEVSSRLKDQIVVKNGDEDVQRALIITFVKDYIVHPDIEKSFCHLGAIDKFDVMPPIGRALSVPERQAVAEWLYDFYEGKEFK